MKPLATLLLIFLTAWTAGFSQSEAVKLKEKADFAAARNGKLEAIQLYSKAIEYDKKYYEAYFKRGKLYFELEDWSKSEESFKSALKGKYQPSKSLYFLGSIASKTENPTIAEDYFSKSLEKDSSGLESYLEWAILLAKNGKWEQALDLARRAERHFPNSWDVFMVFGDIYSFRREFSTALTYYQKSSELDPQNGPIWYNIGNCYLLQKEYKPASINYEKALSINHTDQWSANNLVFCLNQLGEYEKAIEVSRNIILTLPKFAFLRNNYGYALYKTGKVEEGLDQIYRSQKLDPTNSWVNRNLAEIFLEQGDTAKACAEIEKGIELGFKELYGDELERMKAEHCK